MSYSEPARTAARRQAPTLYRARRRRALFAAALALVLVAGALGAGRQVPPRKPRLSPAGRPSDALTVDWPEQGQAALVLGHGVPLASPSQQPAPIASLAKVMTAYLTLVRHPISAEQEGFEIDLGPADAAAAAQDADRNQSIVAVRAGEQLTERQLLEGLLVPSGNNLAETLADVVAGSRAGFVAEMNAEAHALGMRRTVYTDPSGFDQGTVSTAADQLRVFRRAMRYPVFRQIVSMSTVTLPVAGTLTNFNPLVADGYAGKTGSDAAAGGCLAFFTRVRAGGRAVMAAGVVMGQGEGSDTKAILAAAGNAAQRMVGSLAETSRTPRLSPSDEPGAP